jgi:hypothetical protein
MTIKLIKTSVKSVFSKYNLILFFCTLLLFSAALACQVLVLTYKLSQQLLLFDFFFFFLFMGKAALLRRA